MVFVEDPAFYMQWIGLKLPSIMDPEKQAIIDQKHALAVNYETFFFASLEEKQQLGENIVEHCGLLTDPVSKKRFRPHEKCPRYDLGDHPYFFLSEANRAKFEASPGEFTAPKFPMRGKMARDSS